MNKILWRIILWSGAAIALTSRFLFKDLTSPMPIIVGNTIMFIGIVGLLLSSRQRQN
jgi:hypothetical protein